MGLESALSSWERENTLADTQTLVQNIVTSLTDSQNIFDTQVFNTHLKQKIFLQAQLEKNISRTPLTQEEKQELQQKILETLLNLDILLPENPKTGYFRTLPKRVSAHVRDFFIGTSTYASEPSHISSQERAILLLKTQVQIQKLLQKSIDTEIALNNGSISAVEYNTLINQNLVSIEELLIFQESLENDTIAISLDDIQRFQLGSYVDDSQQLITLQPIAYIESKRGHAMVQNLNGSTKLAQENMMLYP